MVDAQLVGQLVAAGVTALASGGAAFLGVRAANRTTDVEDKRAEDTAEWERIQRLLSMACSQENKEAYVGLSILTESKDDWKDKPEQTAFVRHALDALNKGAVTAYLGDQTTVVTSQSPSAPQSGGP